MDKEKHVRILRAQVEPGRPLDLVTLFAAGDLTTNIEFFWAVPNSREWQATGEPGVVTIYLGDKPSYTAPVEVLKMECRRYDRGLPIFFRRMLLPIRQTARLELTGKHVEIFDFGIQTMRDVC